MQLYIVLHLALYLLLLILTLPQTGPFSHFTTAPLVRQEQISSNYMNFNIICSNAELNLTHYPQGQYKSNYMTSAGFIIINQC